METKPGWRTTEFYFAVVFFAVAVGHLFGFFGGIQLPDVSSVVAGSQLAPIMNGLDKIVTLSLMAWKSIHYLNSRTSLKLAAANTPKSIGSLLSASAGGAQ
jgi:hypothetical protein